MSSFLDGLFSTGAASKLVTPTGTIDVSATMPSAGKVLTAIDATHAEWAEVSAATAAAALEVEGGDPVNVSEGAPPNPGDVLRAVDATHAEWSESVTSAEGLATTTSGPVETLAAPPNTGDVLTAIDGTSAHWAPLPEVSTDADGLNTTGASVDVASAGPPTAGQVLTATDATHAIWKNQQIPFDVATDIAPLHRYMASHVSQSGGLVDRILDQGGTAIDWVQTLAARCPVVNDGFGIPYLAPDGSVDFYTAGVAANWTFLSDGTQWTIAVVSHDPSTLAATQVLLDDCDGTTANRGIHLANAFISSTQQGPNLLVLNAGGGSGGVLTAGSLVPNTNRKVEIFRHCGDVQQFTSGAITPISLDLQLRTQGALVSSCNKKNNFSSTAPPATLTLFRRAITADRFSAKRVYELVIDNKAWSDRQIRGFEEYARTAYNIAI